MAKGVEMTPEDRVAIWQLITSKLDIRDRDIVGLPLVMTGAPRDWITSVLDCLVEYIDRELDGPDSGEPTTTTTEEPFDEQAIH